MAREDESLVQELHDTLCQSLYAHVIHLRAQIESSPELMLALRGAEHCLAEARALLARAAEPLSLRAALHDLKSRPGNDVPVSVSVDDTGEPPPRITRQIVRIVEEATRNAVRHSHAPLVTITGRTSPEQVALAIRDRGIGFTLAAERNERFGITGMMTRAEAIEGVLEIATHPGHGTCVVFRWRDQGTDQASPVERVHRLIGRARRQARSGSCVKARLALQRASSIADRIEGDEGRWMRARVVAAELTVARMSGDDAPKPSATRVFTLADGTDPGAALVRSECALDAWASGALDDAEAWLSPLSSVAMPSAPLDAITARLAVRRAEGNLYLGRGLCLLARRAFDESLTLARLLGEPWEESIALYNIGETYAVAGELDVARGFFEQAKACKQPIRDAWGLAYTYHGLARASLELGDTTLARRGLEAMQRTLVRVNDRRVRDMHRTLAQAMPPR